MEISLQPVAFIGNNRSDITDDNWGEVVSEIKLAPGVPAEALNGIETFSHLEIIYFFDRLAHEPFRYTGHPRGNKAWPEMGIFAQRKKDRPNHIGLCVAELLQRKGDTLIVKKLDAIDGTPVLDIKPVMQEFMPKGEVRQPAWVGELMEKYWL